MKSELFLLIIQGSVGETLAKATGRSEPLGKFIVFLLLVFSIVLWSIVVLKWLQFKRAKWGNRRFLGLFNSVDNDFHLAYDHAQSQPGTPLADIFSEIYKELRALSKSETGKLVITSGAIDLVQKAADRQIALMVSHLERYLTIVGTIAHVSPLLGLFGTVWGVLVAFTDMGAQGTTDLTVVAPGIAGALITTVAGLAAAIPAAICFNYLNRRVEDQFGEMEDFVSRLVSFLERNIVKRSARQVQEQ